MKAVLLDKITIGDDISLQVIEDQCDLTCYELTNKNEIFERIKDAEIIITNKVIIGKDEMAMAKSLKLICVAATGINNIDIGEAKNRGVVVANVSGYSTESVAQTVFAYILNILNSASKYSEDIKSKLWQQSPVFTMLNYPITELKGKKVGIIGYGNIGKRVAEIAKAFHAEVLICESLVKTDKDTTRFPLTTVLEQSDIITLHLPLNDQTFNLIAEDELKLMKNSAILINTARGGIINENDLYHALKNGEIAYAATDVLTAEPPTNGNILFNAPNIIITPHIAWTSKEARIKLAEGIAENIRNYMQGNADLINLY
jgi:glycerate dehydrogenase